MAAPLIADKSFTVVDQERFAAASGDRNPIHMDVVAARRTLAGQPVVHGIHALLWSLDGLYQQVPDLPAVASISVRFEKMIYLGVRTSAVLVDRSRDGIRLDVLSEGRTAVTVRLVFGHPVPSPETCDRGEAFQPREPISLTFDDMVDYQGCAPFFSPAEAVVRLFPYAARALGGERIAGLACSSFIVGMICPGRHSMYRSLKFATTSPANADGNRLHFSVTHADPRFRLVRLAITGAGWHGSLDAHALPPPTSQPTMDEIATKVVGDEFRGTSALVIGGTRGLGELIGKILAVGGADLTLTYSVGEADAHGVQAQIAGHGGRCEIMRYDVRAAADGQLQSLERMPDQIYYMATPQIFRQSRSLFQQKYLDEFLAFYVSGFYDLHAALRQKYGTDFSMFYPSSIYVDTRPRDMTEYAMAKAAGELLCADMQAFERSGRIVMRRLPRLPTDQTASLVEERMADPIDLMVAIIREIQAGQVATRATSTT
ncbi:MaoC/PaaZ C-terminal domain-containing protein [Reyranella sp. CPCC 100927]|uniref:MaoC/PaaZ C-terminal domain-containing protein n=1 Tax=Reyranella sp. CPCC 100927 TaxID=2599616 RepID=UPI0015B6FE46|nr:MaoC/PaaZ C-terminal domain-containing protein [Reyranella sp. CPCC 100927]